MTSAPRCLNVVVVGAGAAATEAVFVLREHGGARMRITVIAPEEGPAPRALPVAEPFFALRHRVRPLAALARELGAAVVPGRVVAVDDHRHRVHLNGGRTVGYDALVLAVGAAARHTIDRALTLFGEAGAVAVDRVLAGGAPVVDFVVPPGITRALALYELAVHTGDEVRARGADVALRVLTHERAPLEAFGDETARAIGALLHEANVAFEGSASVFEGLDGGLRVNDVGTLLPGARTVALPVLDGPSLPGVPATADGFIPVDDHGAVPGLTDVFAAGDATACPVKHVDVGCAQAATIADVLAERAGAHIAPQPWRPTVREHLFAEHGIGDLALAGDQAAETAAIIRVIADDDSTRVG